MSKDNNIEKLSLNELTDRINDLKMKLKSGSLKEKHEVSRHRKEIARRLTQTNNKNGEFNDKE